jgi:ABC-type glutathione transport system ATPase component
MLAGGYLTKRFGATIAVEAVSIAVAPGETLALIGRSGSGKSTLARLLACLVVPDYGVVTRDGTPVALGGDLAFRRAVQFLPQDVDRALNPAHTVATLLARPMRRHAIGSDAADRASRAAAALTRVALDPALAARYPHELSGGQRQRVALARMLALAPRTLILDEPFSALDVATTVEILALLRRLQDEAGFGCLLVTHDIDVAAAFAHRLAVMHDGRIVESGVAAHVLAEPQHAETRALAGARRPRAAAD